MMILVEFIPSAGNHVRGFNKGEWGPGPDDDDDDENDDGKKA